MSNPAISFSGKHSKDNFLLYLNALTGEAVIYARINWYYWIPRLEVVIEKVEQ